MKSKSFTLIELLVVIVIIGILAGIIIISTTSSIEKANIAKAHSFSNTIKNELFFNLVSEWTFDEDTAGIAKDTWGNSDGTLVGAAGTQNLPQIQNSSECVCGKCLKFDGEDDYVSITNTNNLKNNQITYSLWIKPLSFLSSQGRSAHFIYWPMGDVVGFILGERVLAYVKLNNVRQYVYGGLIKLNEWTFLSFTYNGTTEYFYTNGTRTGELNYNSSVIGYTGNLFALGTADDLISYCYNGLMDDVRIYNAALSSAQIKQQYVAGLDSLLTNNNISKEEYDQRLNSLAYTD